MLKKRFFEASVMVAALMLIGCSTQVVTKGNNLQGKYIAAAANGISVVADLAVAEKKVMGKAKGNIFNTAELEKEAILNALLQGSSGAPADVLVAANFFYETVDNDVTVTVIGYPARYRNFRSDNINTAMPAQDSPESVKPRTPSTFTSEGEY